MSRMHRVATLAILLTPTALPAQSLPTVAAAHRVADSLARDFVARGEAPSVAIAVIRGADTIAFLAHGMADVELQVPATPASVYRIGSVTKQFTAVAVMQLAEQGKLSLDDSIAVHLADLPAAWRSVTVRQLLNHTSGIPSYTAIGAEWQRRWGEEMLPRTIIGMVADKPIDFAPGLQHRYNNTGYILLGMLIEELTDTRWGADLEERFSESLGLADTRNCMNGPIIPRRARGYEKLGDGWQNAAYLAMTQPYAAGAMCSTLGDMVTWNRALHAGTLVTGASYAVMTTPVPPAGSGAMGYGFGLAADTVARQRMVAHGGGIHGFSTANAWVPSAELSVTVLANSGSARTNPLMGQLARAALGQPLMVAPTVLPLSAADRDRYIGTYVLQLPPGPMDFVVATAADGTLTGKMGGQPALPLKFLGDHTFGADFDPTVRVIFAVVDGRATGMTLRQRGQETRGARK